MFIKLLHIDVNGGKVRRRFHRGVSPVIAVLLLIIIAVAAGLLIYIWVSGYISGQTSSLATQPPKIAGASAKWAGGTLIIDTLVHNPAPTDTTVDLKAYPGALSKPPQTDMMKEIASTKASLRAGELKRITLSSTATPSGASVVTIFLYVDLDNDGTYEDEEIVDSLIISIPPS